MVDKQPTGSFTEHCPLSVEHVVLRVVSVKPRRVRVAHTRQAAPTASSAGYGASCFAGVECAAAQSSRGKHTSDKLLSQSIVSWLAEQVVLLLSVCSSTEFAW